MKLLGIDLEIGNEFDKEIDKINITEVGMVLWDTEFNAPVKIFNTLVDSNMPISEEAMDYTGITREMVQTYGMGTAKTAGVIARAMKEADWCVAHNARGAEDPWLKMFFKQTGLDMPSCRWIDTMTDVEYPRRMTSMKLGSLAQDHKILNCFQHRAVTDVLTMFEILKEYDLSRVVKVAESPMVRVIANVSFNEKDKAKNAKFRWEGENKIWFKEVKKIFLDEGKFSWDFDHKIEEVNGSNV